MDRTAEGGIDSRQRIGEIRSFLLSLPLSLIPSRQTPKLKKKKKPKRERPQVSEVRIASRLDPKRRAQLAGREQAEGCESLAPKRRESLANKDGGKACSGGEGGGYPRRTKRYLSLEGRQSGDKGALAPGILGGEHSSVLIHKLPTSGGGGED